jgi:hypothetical protein
MMEIWFGIVIAQLVVSLYLAWKAHDLTKEIEDTQIVLGSVLYQLQQYEDEDDEPYH